MTAIKTNVGSSLMRFVFTDEEEKTIASFRMNPADVKLAHRCQEVISFFENLENQTTAETTLEEAVKFNDEVEEKICYLLGYDARQSLFGFISATAIMGTGELFATIIMDKILEHILPEIQKRKQSVAETVRKYTDKYTK